MIDMLRFIQMMVALSLWIAAIMAILSCLLNGLDWLYLTGALVAWLLAFWIWPRERQRYRREQRAQHGQDWSGVCDLADLIFALIEWPLRLLAYLLRGLAHWLD